MEWEHEVELRRELEKRLEEMNAKHELDSQGIVPDDKITVKVRKINDAAEIPEYETVGSAGVDLRAAIDRQVIAIPADDTVLIPTGLCMEIPEGYAGFIFARSDLAAKRGLAPANKVGVVDSDYRGEIMVALHNHSCVAQTVRLGDRIAQMVFLPVARAAFEVVDSLDDTERGEGGFGPTGR